MSLNVDLKSEKRNMYIDNRNLPFYSPTWFRKSLDFSMKLIWSWSGNGIPCFWILQERFIKVLTPFLWKNNLHFPLIRLGVSKIVWILVGLYPCDFTRLFPLTSNLMRIENCRNDAVFLFCLLRPCFKFKYS